MTRITIIGFGTRGDAQPAIAVGKGLQAAGHEVRVLASANFQEWIAGHGLEPVATTVDVQAMMESEGGQEWVERGHNPLVQTRIMKRLFASRGWDLMMDAWQASQDAGLLISSFTSDAFAVSIAEKLGIPQASLVTQPALIATRNGRVLPNAPLPNRTSLLNYLFARLLIEPYGWQMVGEITNRFRQEVLGLPPQSRAENTAARRRMLTLMGYSRHLVPHPADWPDHFYTTGYWFLEEGDGWQPPAGLLDFLAAGEKPVSIGFGSMTGRDPRQLTEVVAAAVEQSGTRAILLSGWAGLGEMALPDTIYCLPRAPHSWLFPRVAAVVHHGGAGTVAAGLLAGRPSVIVPHFADQPYWGRRVHALGAGPEPIPRHKLAVEKLAAAIYTAATDPGMAQRAGELGQKIAQENGVETAVRILDGAC